MRVVSLLFLFLCGLSVSVAPERLIANDQAVAMVDDAAGQAQYEALQTEANMALDLLRQAQERHRLAAQVAAN